MICAGMNSLTLIFVDSSADPVCCDDDEFSKLFFLTTSSSIGIHSAFSQTESLLSDARPSTSTSNRLGLEYDLDVKCVVQRYNYCLRFCRCNEKSGFAGIKTLGC